MDGKRSIGALAREAGFGELTGELESLARPALVLSETDDERRVGRLGGEPRLPPNVPWPRTPWPSMRGKPLAFFAELDLALLDPAVWPGPRAGTLSFFCRVNADAMYVDSSGAALVLHHPPEGQLEPKPLPDDLEPELRLREIGVSATSTVTLPWIGVGPARELIPFGLDAMEDIERATAYCHLAEQVQGGIRGTPHQLLGWPRFTQDDVAYVWPMLNEESRQRGLVDDAPPDDWRLLLQVAGDPHLGAEFGDGGDLFFAIPAGDLEKGRFDRVEAITDSG